MEGETNNKNKIISTRFSQAEYEIIKKSAENHFNVKYKEDEKPHRLISKYIRMKVLSDTTPQVKTAPIQIYNATLFRECKSIPRSLNDLAKQANHMAKTANSDNAKQMLAIINMSLKRIYDHLKQYADDSAKISTEEK